jgi:hypothetical protein
VTIATSPKQLTTTLFVAQGSARLDWKQGGFSEKKKSTKSPPEHSLTTPAPFTPPRLFSPSQHASLSFGQKKKTPSLREDNPHFYFIFSGSIVIKASSLLFLPSPLFLAGITLDTLS